MSWQPKRWLRNLPNFSQPCDSLDPTTERGDDLRKRRRDFYVMGWSGYSVVCENFEVPTFCFSDPLTDEGLFIIHIWDSQLLFYQNLFWTKFCNLNSCFYFPHEGSSEGVNSRLPCTVLLSIQNKFDSAFNGVVWDSKIDSSDDYYINNNSNDPGDTRQTSATICRI